jgi:hypothetical protein
MGFVRLLGHDAVLNNATVLIAGGYDSSVLTSAELY